MTFKNMKVDYVVIIIFLLILVGCGNSAKTSPTSQSQIAENSQIDSLVIRLTGSDFQEIDQEIVPQNNCGGTAEVENIIEKSRNVSHVMEVGSEFSVNTSGEVGFAGTGVELGAEVSSSLGYQYGTNENISRSVTVKAVPGTNMEHTIRLLEVWEIGEASVIVNSLQDLIPFRFRTDFKVELVKSQNLGCPSQGQNDDIILSTPVTAPQTEASNNANWYEGTWFGTINQSGSSEYEGLFQFNQAKIGEIFGTSNYIQLDCGGDLTLLSITDDEIEFREQITFGRSGCISGLRKTLRFFDDSSIHYSISPGQGYTASGTLRRQ